MSDLRSLFLIRPDVTFLNHGSFGACPRPVFEEYQRWQLELEREPVEFLGRRAPELLRWARTELGAFVGCDPVDLVYVPNATFGVNIVARSLDLGPGDEVLTIDHEYGACNRVWRFLAGKRGFAYREMEFDLPFSSHEEFVEQFMARVTDATRVIFLSHITAPTALTLPVAEICALARERGILTLIDGAHAPGQIPLDIDAIGCDFYTGNLHKWLCAPKGAAFLYARREAQALLEPLVVGWGYEAVVPGDSLFIDHLESWGTRDIAPTLTVPAAIRFMKEYDWESVRAGCASLVVQARAAITDALGMAPACPDGGGWFAQMSAFIVPPHINGPELHRRLFDEHLIEIPVFRWRDDVDMLRISIQGYNTWDDVERLISAAQSIIADTR